MKKFNYLVLLFFILNSSLFGQNVDTRIKEIREMHQKIVSEKDSYVAKEKEVTWDVFEYNEEDDRYVKAIIISFFNNEEKKIVEVKSEISQQWFHNLNTIECYFDNDSLFFTYVVNERANYKYEESGIKVDTKKIKEKRIYFDKYGRCIRYLIKDVEGKPEVIDSLRQVTPNVELNCLDAQELIKEVEKYFQ